MVFVSSKEGTNFGKDTTFCTTMIMMCRKKGGFMGRKSAFLLHLPSRMDENAHRGVQNGAIAVGQLCKAKRWRTGWDTVARQRTTANVSSRWDIHLFGKRRSPWPNPPVQKRQRPRNRGAVRGRKTRRDVRAHGRGAIRTRGCRIRDRPYRLSRQRCRSAFLHRSHRKPRQQHVQNSALGA